MLRGVHLRGSAGRGPRITIASVILGLTLTASIAPAVSAVSPPNDGFAGALSAKPLPYTNNQDTTSATTQTNEPDSICANETFTVWYTFKSNSTRYLRATTAGSSYNTSIAIWRGTTLANLQPTTCNSNIQSGDGPFIETSRVTWRAVAGVRYYIQVSGEGESGNLMFRLAQVTPPANDRFGASSVVGALPLNGMADNRKASIEGGEIGALAAGCTASRATLWYRLTSPSSIVARVDTLGALQDTIIAVYTGTSFANLTQRACNDDTAATGSFTYASSVAWRAAAGTDYYVQVAGWQGDTGKFPLRMAAVNPLGNDNWANAQNIPSLPFTGSSNLRNATKQGAEALDSICSTNHWSTAWYRYTAPNTNPLSASVIATGDAFVTALVVYHGPNLANLVEDHCAIDDNLDGLTNVSFTPVQGTTYYFKVTGAGGQTGPVSFNLELD